MDVFSNAKRVTVEAFVSDDGNNGGEDGENIGTFGEGFVKDDLECFINNECPSSNNDERNNSQEDESKIVVVENVGSGPRSPEEMEEKAEQLRTIHENDDRWKGHDDDGTFEAHTDTDGKDRETIFDSHERGNQD